MSDSSSSSISEPVVRPHSALDRDAPSPLDTDVEDGHELQPGDVFAGWEVESLIGRGGMGTVYRVNRAGTKAALKILQPTYLANERYRQRFLFECQQLQTLNHPNIVRLLEFGTRGDVPYLTMELIEGTDLHTLVEERGPLPWEQATRLVLTIARGLEFARRRGLIHRDIKPENVLLQRKGRLARAKIVDFGLIKQITSEHGDENLLTLQPQDWFGVMDRFQAHMDRVLQRDWSRRRTDLEIREVLRELRDVLYTAKRIELPQDSDTSYRHRGGKATGRTGRIGQVRRSSTSGRRTTTNGRGRTRALGLTQDGECLGTPYFMAPEMWLEVPADHRADIFSLGVTW
ncbi:MAG: serine/threonine-protein kinase, partial [Planctomycetota bacterium]